MIPHLIGFFIPSYLILSAHFELKRPPTAVVLCSKPASLFNGELRWRKVKFVVTVKPRSRKRRSRRSRSPPPRSGRLRHRPRRNSGKNSIVAESGMKTAASSGTLMPAPGARPPWRQLADSSGVRSRTDVPLTWSFVSVWTLSVPCRCSGSMRKNLEDCVESRAARIPLPRLARQNCA
jgi:hypothetical protein